MATQAIPCCCAQSLRLKIALPVSILWWILSTPTSKRGKHGRTACKVERKQYVHVLNGLTCDAAAHVSDVVVLSERASADRVTRRRSKAASVAGRLLCHPQAESEQRPREEA